MEIESTQSRRRQLREINCDRKLITNILWLLFVFAVINDVLRW